MPTRPPNHLIERSAAPRTTEQYPSSCKRRALPATTAPRRVTHMRIPRLPLLTFSLVLGLFAWTTHPALAAEITCGSVLGPGGTFVLNRDLTCPFTPDPEDLSAGDPVLTVIAGATLDLNGHTVRCSGRGPGMHVYRATVLNGTVIGCREGVYVGGSGSVVQGMTVKRNGSGI